MKTKNSPTKKESNNPVKEVSDIAQTLLDVISKPLLIDHHEMFITASIGISVYPSDGEEDLTLLKNADTAMSRAKAQGKNRVV